jgi:hypothetical protein
LTSKKDLRGFESCKLLLELEAQLRALVFGKALAHLRENGAVDRGAGVVSSA